MVEFVDATRKSPPLGTELQAALNLIPAHAWYAAPSGALTFLNVRGSDYLGLPKDHHLRSGIDTGATWDAHIQFLHPDDQEEIKSDDWFKVRALEQEPPMTSECARR